MGGTTAKLCLIDQFRPQTARKFEIALAARFIKGSGMPVRIPVIEMIEIGAGGGSIASVDRLGRLQVGPESAGSDPGPAAFGAGGALEKEFLRFGRPPWLPAPPPPPPPPPPAWPSPHGPTRTLGTQRRPVGGWGVPEEA